VLHIGSVQIYLKKKKEEEKEKEEKEMEKCLTFLVICFLNKIKMTTTMVMMMMTSSQYFNLKLCSSKQ